MTRILPFIAAIVLAAGALAQEPPAAAPAKPLPVEKLGVPVTTMESADFTAYTADGKAFHLIFFHPMRNPMACQVRIIDLATGEVTEASGPADRPLHMVEFEGKFYLGQYGLCGLWVFDPATKKIEYKAGPQIGRCVVFRLGVGEDRMIYMGMSSGCEIVQFDPRTSAFRNYGRQGPKVEGPRYVYSMATEGGYVYSAAGKNPWYLVALDTKTGEQKILLDDDPKYLSVSGRKGCATATATYAGKDGKDISKTWILKDGQKIEPTLQATDNKGSLLLLSADKSEVTLWANGQRKTISLASLPATARDFTGAAICGGKAALARRGAVVLLDIATDKPVEMPLQRPDQTPAALTVTDKGVVLFGLAETKDLLVADAGQLRALATLPGKAARIVAEEGFAYVSTTDAQAVTIVDLANGQVTPVSSGGHLGYIHGKLYTSERGVQVAVGNGIFVPARIRLDQGKAVPDARFPDYDMHHNYFAAPETVMDSIQPDGSFAFYWKGRMAKEWKSAQVKIAALPIKIESLHPLPDGRIFGSTRRYQEAFAYSPTDGKFEVFGKLPMSGAKTVTIKGKIYMAAYPGIRIMVYDPARKWTLGMARPDAPVPAEDSPDSNPRLLTHAGMVPEQRMPAHFARDVALGADQCIYIGAHCERSHVGGALGWLDPGSGKLDAVARDPFLVLDCAGIAAAEDGRKIVYSSQVVSDPAKKTPTPKEAKLFILDVAGRKIAAEHVPFPGAPSTGDILARGQTVIGFLRNKLYLFDLATGKVTKTADLPEGQAPSFQIWGPDGQIYLFIGGDLMRLDPVTLDRMLLGSVDPNEVGPIVFAGNDLYIAGRPELRRVKSATTLK